MIFRLVDVQPKTVNVFRSGSHAAGTWLMVLQGDKVRIDQNSRRY